MGCVLDAERRRHAVVVARVRPVEGSVEAPARLEGLAAKALVSTADEDVVDAAIGFAKKGGEGIRPGVRGAGRTVAGEGEGILEVDGPGASEGRQAVEEADLVGARLGVEVSDE